jgi:Transposase DDE domain
MRRKTEKKLAMLYSIDTIYGMLDRLSTLPLDSLAKISGFVIRRPKKLSLGAFLQSLLLNLGQPSFSLASWAAQLSALQSGLFSKQALHRRCGAGMANFLQLAIAALLGNFTRRDCPAEVFNQFGRVLLQDSTALALHRSLAKHFPGCGNQHQRSLASVKIQAIFDLRSQSWVHFELGSLTDNDQKASPLILAHLQKGDLVIRDLGYAVFKVWRQIAAQGAYFLSRWRNDFSLLDPQTQEPLDLLTLLLNRPQLGMDVLVGASERLPVRLVALRLPAPLAAQRRRRARANAKRDRHLHLTKRYLKLLDWTILLTNVSAEQLSDQQLLEVYGCRWQIEVLFKSWKSHFKLGQLPPSGPMQVQIQLLAKLLALTLIQNTFHPGWLAGHQRPLSLLKIASYFSRLLPLIITSPHQDWLEHFLYFCRYDSRSDRSNFFQRLASL